MSEEWSKHRRVSCLNSPHDLYSVYTLSLGLHPPISLAPWRFARNSSSIKDTGLISLAEQSFRITFWQMSTSPLLSHHSQAGPSGSQPRLSSPRHTRTQHGHHHFPRPSSSSTSSYAPVLINHTQISQDYLSPPSSNSPTAGGLSLIYPYPLPIASLLDLAYTIYHHRRYLNKSPESGNTTGLLIGGTIARAVILIGVVGCSRQWRSRGGWVAAICGISIGLDIWEDCAERLGARGPKKGSGRGKGESMALYIVCFSSN